jgi:hypothetical protein
LRVAGPFHNILPVRHCRRLSERWLLSWSTLPSWLTDQKSGTREAKREGAGEASTSLAHTNRAAPVARCRVWSADALGRCHWHCRLDDCGLSGLNCTAHAIAKAVGLVRKLCAKVPRGCQAQF